MQQASVPFLVLGQDILRTVYTHTNAAVTGVSVRLTIMVPS